MILSDFLILKQILFIFSISQTLQIFEYLQINRKFAVVNPWLRSHEQRKIFQWVQWIRLLLTLLLPTPFCPTWITLILLFCAHIWTLYQFSGSFNGGSDDVSTQTFLGLLIAVFMTPHIGLWFLGFQLMASYFAAGLVKIKNPDWRSGKALQYFLTAPQYTLSPQFKISLSTAKYLSYGVLIFELSAPLNLFFPDLIFIYLGIGIGFHFVNYFIFGLNRFFWSWIVLYPALLFCVKNLS